MLILKNKLLEDAKVHSRFWFARNRDGQNPRNPGGVCWSCAQGLLTEFKFKHTGGGAQEYNAVFVVINVLLVRL